MAQFFKLTTGEYINLSMVARAFVGPDLNGAATFSILLRYGPSGDIIEAATGFLTTAAAQTALDNAISTKYGGS